LPLRRRTPAMAVVSGVQIRAARERSGLSRQAFAKRLGVSQGAVYLWVSGGSTPPGANARRLRVLTTAALSVTLSVAVWPSLMANSVAQLPLPNSPRRP